MTSLQAYLDAGGGKFDDDIKKSSIFKLLPWKIRERVLWDFDDYKSCEQLVGWIKVNVRITASLGLGGAEAHSVETQELDEQGQRELAALGRDADAEEVNAAFRRGQVRFAQRRWPSKKQDSGGGARPVRAPARPGSG